MADEKIIFRMDFEGGDKILEEIVKIKSETEKLKEQRDQLSETAKKGTLEEKKAYQALEIQIKENNKEVNALTRQYGANAKQVKETGGSLVSMRKQLRQMNAEFDSLTKEQRENEQVGGQLNKRIKELNEELTLAEESTGRYQRSVGKYKESIEAAAGSISAKREKLKELKKTLEETDPSEDATKFNKLRGEIDGLTHDIGVLSGEYDEFGNRAKRNPAAEELSTMADSAKGAMSSLAILNMMMGDSENAAMVQARAVQGMAIAQNAHNIAVGAAKLPQTAAIVGLKAKTAAQWALNAAMNANPILKITTLIIALGTAIWALIANFDKLTSAVQKAWRWLTPWVDRTDEAAEASARHTAEVERQTKAQNDLTAEIQRGSRAMNKQISDMEFQLQLMQARGDETRKQTALERQILELRIEQAKADVRAAMRNGELTDEITENLVRTERALILFDATQNRLRREQQNRTVEEIEDEEEKINKFEELRDRQLKWDEDRRLSQLDTIERFNDQELKLLDQQYAENLISYEEYGELLLSLQDEVNRRMVEKKENEAEQERILEEQAREKEVEQFTKWLETQQKRDEDELDRITAKESEIEDLRQRDIINETQYREALAQLAKDQADLEWQAAMTRIRAQRAARDATTAALDSIGAAMQGGSRAMVNFARFTKSISIANSLANIIAGFSASAKIGFPQNIAAIAGYVGQTAGLISQIRSVAIPPVPQFNTGGRVSGSGRKDTVPAMLTPGEGILRANAMDSGDYWNLSGTPKQIASTLNQAYGGVEFRNTGGIAGSSARGATRNASDALSRENLLDAFRAIRVVTTVEDINARVRSEEIRNKIATL